MSPSIACCSVPLLPHLLAGDYSVVDLWCDDLNLGVSPRTCSFYLYMPLIVRSPRRRGCALRVMPSVDLLYL